VLSLALTVACGDAMRGDPPSADADLGAASTALIGCSDLERESFVDQDMHRRIAGCAGGFELPGLVADALPTCGRRAGDDGDNAAGVGCRAADLCAIGWHICRDADDVADSSGTGSCSDETDQTDERAPAFFGTGQSGPGSGLCGVGANDLFGCGSLGSEPGGGCGTLTRYSHDLCAALEPPWDCGVDTSAEATNVTKPAPEAGGVLCCRD
jgi:hypothetical protein